MVSKKQIFNAKAQRKRKVRKVIILFCIFLIQLSFRINRGYHFLRSQRTRRLINNPNFTSNIFFYRTFAITILF